MCPVSEADPHFPYCFDEVQVFLVSKWSHMIVFHSIVTGTLDIHSVSMECLTSTCDFT
jgi:hypothetical protein